MNRRVIWLLLLSMSTACGRCDSEKPTPAAPSATISAAPVTSESPESGGKRGGDDVEPVYPKIAGPADPLAEKFCAALYDVPNKRQAECCQSTPGFSLTSECVRILSHALRDKSVSLDAAAVDSCAAGVTAAHQGCEWVGPTNVALPETCEGIIRGNIEEGKRCRSSLECQEGLRCVGLGPTDLGVCRKPSPTGFPCSIAVDTLVAVTRQASLDAHHPECAGYCTQRRCRDFVAVHGACKANAECGAGKVCLGGACEEGQAPSEGKSCAKTACATGLVCEKGTCLARKKAGESCVTDAECQGGCVRKNGSREGSCGPKCSWR